MRSAFKGLLLVLVALVACLAGACSSGNTEGGGGTAAAGGSGGSGGGPPGTTTIDARGGAANSASGAGSVSVPAGAVASGTVAIIVDELNRADFPDPDGRWSDVFRFGPDGTNFDIPVTIAIALDQDRVDSAATLWKLNETTQA